MSTDPRTAYDYTRELADIRGGGPDVPTFDPHEEARDAESHRKRMDAHLASGHREGTCMECAPGWGP